MGIFRKLVLVLHRLNVGQVESGTTYLTIRTRGVENEVKIHNVLQQSAINKCGKQNALAIVERHPREAYMYMSIYMYVFNQMPPNVK